MAAQSVENPFVNLFPFEPSFIASLISLLLRDDTFAFLEHSPEEVALPIFFNLFYAALAGHLRDQRRDVRIFARVSIIE